MAFVLYTAKMEAEGASETSVCLCQITRRLLSENSYRDVSRVELKAVNEMAAKSIRRISKR
jgi:hypothetical protein